MKVKLHSSRRCPIHGGLLVERHNSKAKGSIFHGCSELETLGCKVSWSDRDQKFWGDPRVVARASSRHGRVVSRRETVLAFLVSKGLSSSEARRLVDEEGLLNAERLFDVSV